MDSKQTQQTERHALIIFTTLLSVFIIGFSMGYFYYMNHNKLSSSEEYYIRGQEDAYDLVIAEQTGDVKWASKIRERSKKIHLQHDNGEKILTELD